MSESSSVRRQQVIFRGRVQGVGFRITTKSIAKRHPVVGYVKNLPDGAVEMVAEAESSALDLFLADILREFAANVRQYDSSNLPRDEPLTTFEIRH